MYKLPNCIKIQTLHNMLKRREKNNIISKNMSPACLSHNHHVWKRKTLVGGGQRFIRGASFYFQILGVKKGHLYINQQKN